MRVAHLAPTSLPLIGGAEIGLHNLSVEQARRGHEVTVIARWPIARLAAKRLPYRTVPLAPATFRQAMRSELTPGHWLLRRQIERRQRVGRFDVWHVHMAHPVGWGAIGPLRAMGVPAVLTAHGADLMVEPSIGYGHRLVPMIDDRIRRTVGDYDAVAAINAEIHETFTEMGVPADRIHDVPNGIDVDRVARHPVDRRGVRRRYGLPEDSELVLTVARYDPVKGLDVLPEAAAAITRERPSARWLVIGQGTDALAPQVRRLGLDDLVHLDAAPARPSGESLPSAQLLDAYRAADVFVLPSRVEGMPLVILEAMAAGLPVVAGDVSGCRDLVIHGETGLLHPVGDAPTLAEAVIRILEDPTERQAMARRAQRRADGFSVPAMADAYDDLYRDVVNGRPR